MLMYRMIDKVFIVSLILLASMSLGAQEESPSSAAHKVESKRPNIVFILADDLGFTDIAPYGSEVNTPSLSALAERGVRFTNYHTAANCAPSRAMLLTGVSNHLAGVPNIPEMIAPEQAVQDNYQGVLGNNVVTVATLLEDAGYHTYMAGKWHLGMTPDKLPSRRGFQRTVAMADSGADNWEQKPYLPIYDKANWFADGEEHQLPEDFYSSTYLVDKTIEFIDGNLADDKPFFAYLPFMAVHIPVQAPQQYIDRYMDTYVAGWDQLREQRAKNAIALGIVPPNTDKVRMPETEAWGELSEDRQRYEAKRMAVYAAMIEAMDAELGRLIDYLKQRGEYDNTVFVFTSDNGSEANGPRNPTRIGASVGPARLGYNVDYETLGLRGSYPTIGANFASASVSPLAFYKFYTGEGGMRVPLIIAGHGIAAQQKLSHSFAWATDITPTILSMAGVAQAGERYAGRPVERITGKDLSPLLMTDHKGQVAARVRADDEVVGYELTGHGALFQGDYKIVVNQAPIGDGEWRLFNIVTDAGETNDLRDEMPQRFQQMMAAYEQFKIDNRVAPLPEGYSQIKQMVLNTLQKFASSFIVLLLTLLVLLPFYVAWRMQEDKK